MKIFFLACCFSFSFISKAAWTDLNTGISDDLTGVVFWGNNGFICGQHGLYYTTSGGAGPSSWTHFTISGNPTDSLTYSNTQFSHAFAATSAHTNYAFACGQDTVNDLAIIFQFYIPTQAYQILYQGTTNTKLNNLRYSYESDQYYAVGDNGLIVRFNLNINGFTEASGGGIDYESINFSGDKVTVGTNNYKTYGVDNNPGLQLTSYSASGKHLKDSWHYGTYNAYFVGNGFYAVNFITHVLTTFSNYNFGALNANSLHKVGTYYFIGTDHGIFRFTTPAAIEWQPSSMQNFIYDFWNQSSISPIYACGKNGVLLVTTDQGGTPLPYMNVVEGGGCKGQSLTMTGTYGSATSCQWYLNGSLVSSSCANYSMLGSATGIYEIKFKGTNSAGTDSSQVIFYVVDTPEINLPVMLNDTILCKKEPVIIDIDQSQMNVFYELSAGVSGASYGGSPEGNGGIISFTTDSISQGGDYLLKANSTLAACSIKFTDTLQIEVEHTKASYHVSKTNLIPGEETQLYETCLEAANYHWEFPSGSMYLTSSLADPINTFSNTGDQQINLLCWSDNFCYDSITGPGPTVYMPPAVYDSCWVNQSNGDDPEWLGQYFYDIADMTPMSDGGYITSGTFHNNSFATTYGDSLQLDWFGSYLCRYDKNGVYKWNVHSVGAGDGYITAGSNMNKFSIKSTAVDTAGNIFGCGYFQNYYVDNVGDTILTPGGFGQVFKLDSLGKTIWQRTTGEIFPYSIEVDHTGDIIITSTRSDYFNNGTPLSLNGVITDTLPAPIGNYGITKFSSDGDLVWDVPIEMDNTNSIDLLGVRFDDQDNIYLTGSYEYNATIYSVGVTNVVTNVSVGQYGRKMLLAKFNSGGTLQWLTRSHSSSPSGVTSNDATHPFDMSTDGEGNCYISGANQAHLSDRIHYFENVDGTLDSMDAGIYFVMKVNSSGNCLWMRGPSAAYYGAAHETELIEDTLYLLAGMNAGALPVSVVSLPNVDGSVVTFEIDQGDYFVGVYDTAGYIYRVFKNGDNGTEFSKNDFNGFHRGVDGNFYAARNDSQIPSTILSYIDFGDTITTINGYEGWVTKFCEYCGITYEASFQQVIDTTLCSGASYTLSDGTMLTGITTEIHDTLILNSINSIDSVIITHIYINGYPDLLDSVSICYDENYTFPDGTTLNNIIASTSYASALQTTLGCDSIITTVVTPIPPVTNSTDSVSVCYDGSYTFMDGFTLNNITTQTAHDNYFTTVAGCDSIIQTIVYPLGAINSTVTVTAAELSSNYPPAPGVTYQWVDCLNAYASLGGETNAVFVPTSDGSYAVIVTNNGCSDTSACEVFDVIGIDESVTGITVYPNPTDGEIYVSFEQVNEYASIRILNDLGQEIATIPVQNKTTIINLPIADGVYYLQFIKENGTIVTKVILKV